MHWKLVLVFVVLLANSATAASSKWFKGNLHTHSFWSDGDEFPEMIAEWYRTNGYDFLAFSDHNTLQSSNKWAPMNTELRLTRVYSRDIGTLLAEKSGKSATYKFEGDEIYVRAKVISSRLNAAEQRGKEPIDPQVLARNPFAYQAAWTQPAIPPQRTGR